MAAGEANVGLDRWLLGDKWTPKQMEIFEGKVKDLGVTRKEFAEVARLEMGSEVAELSCGPRRQNQKGLWLPTEGQATSQRIRTRETRSFSVRRLTASSPLEPN
jgi:hypothetical protein